MGRALYSRNECCNNQLKTIFFPDNSFFQVHSHFSRIFKKIIKFQYFSRTGKTVVIFPGFSGAVGTLSLEDVSYAKNMEDHHQSLVLIRSFQLSRGTHWQDIFYWKKMGLSHSCWCILKVLSSEETSQFYICSHLCRNSHHCNRIRLTRHHQK